MTAAPTRRAQIEAAIARYGTPEATIDAYRAEVFRIWDVMEEVNAHVDDPVHDHGGNDPYPCGTAAGYRRHYRHGEKPCDPCKEAKEPLDAGRKRG